MYLYVYLHTHKLRNEQRNQTNTQTMKQGKNQTNKANKETKKRTKKKQTNKHMNKQTQQTKKKHTYTDIHANKNIFIHTCGAYIHDDTCEDDATPGYLLLKQQMQSFVRKCTYPTK